MELQVATVSSAAAGGCTSHELGAVTLRGGKLYVLRLKYIQISAEKCLSVRPGLLVF